ncbi:MAG: hypothetical protein R6V04_12655 [bacterium]
MIFNIKKTAKFLVIIILFLLNICIAIETRKAHANIKKALEYAQTCIYMGCPGGNRICAEFHPDSETTVICYERKPN